VPDVQLDDARAPTVHRSAGWRSFAVTSTMRLDVGCCIIPHWCFDWQLFGVYTNKIIIKNEEKRGGREDESM
jgi:hypothetical protein